jgi:hypothetical protein
VRNDLPERRVEGTVACDCDWMSDYVGRTRYAVLHPARSGRGSRGDRRAIRVLHAVQVLALLAIVAALVAALG